MSEPKGKPLLARKVSGEMAAAQNRKKLDSLAEHTMPLIANVKDRITKLAEKTGVSSRPPRPDPRREPSDDPRKDDELLEDVVELPPDTEPEDKPETD